MILFIIKILVAIDIFIYITGHVSVEDIENHNAVLIAQDNTVKREYMGKGVKRIEIKVFCNFVNIFIRIYLDLLTTR